MQLSKPEATPTKNSAINVGDWVQVKIRKRKWLEPKWTGAYELIECTSHAGQVEDKAGASWHHLTRCVPAQTPLRTLARDKTQMAETGETNTVI